MRQDITTLDSAALEAADAEVAAIAEEIVSLKENNKMLQEGDAALAVIELCLLTNL